MLLQVETGQIIDLSSLRRLLLIQVDNKIGDLLTATSLFEPLRARYPGLEIDVLAGPVSAPLLEGHPELSRIFVYDKRNKLKLASLLWALNRRHYGLSLNFESHVSSTTRWLTRLIAAQYNLGFNKAGISPYQISLPDESFLGHITLKHQAVLRRLSATTQIHYSVPLQQASIVHAERSWPVLPQQKRVLVNLLGSCAEKSLTADQSVRLLQLLGKVLPDASIKVSVPPGSQNWIEDIVAKAGFGSPLCELPKLSDFVAIVALADLVLTPDTSVVHLAAAFDRPLLAFYGDPVAKTLWGPNYPQARVIFSPGSLSNLPLDEIEAALDHFQQSGVVND